MKASIDIPRAKGVIATCQNDKKSLEDALATLQQANQTSLAEATRFAAASEGNQLAQQLSDHSQLIDTFLNDINSWLDTVDALQNRLGADASGLMSNPLVMTGFNIFSEMFSSQNSDPIADDAYLNSLADRLAIQDPAMRQEFLSMFAGKTQSEVAQAMQNLGFDLNNPNRSVNYATSSQDMTAANGALIPTATRVVDDHKFGADGTFLGQNDIAGLVNDWSQRYNFNERIVAAYKLYQDTLQNRITTMQNEYDDQKSKAGSIWPLNEDHDYMLLLAQNIKDMKAASQGTGYCPTTAEFQLLDNYLTLGQDYFNTTNSFQADVDRNGRPIQPPDSNMVMFVSGFNSDWVSAVNTADQQAFQMGYDPKDIYIFNYKTNKPIPLSEFIEYNPNNGIKRYTSTYGDLQQVATLNKQIEIWKNFYFQHPDTTVNNNVTQLEQQRDKLINQHPEIADFNFTKQDNLNSHLKNDAENLGSQLDQIQDTNPGRQINLIGNSQGGGIVSGFMIQKDDQGNFLMNDRRNQFVDKYATNVSAQGGAYLAELAVNAKDTGPWYDVLSNVHAQVQDFDDLGAALNSNATHDLSISSPYIQANYEGLQDPAVQQRLIAHRGVEIYAARDDVTTSLPGLVLPGADQVKYVDTKHADLGDKADINMYNYFKGYKAPDFQSDKLRYNAALHKGLPDVNDQLLTLAGKIGVVDHDVQQQVQKDINAPQNTPPVPANWPQPENYPFGSGR